MSGLQTTHLHVVLKQKKTDQENRVSSLEGDLPFQLCWVAHTTRGPPQESRSTLSCTTEIGGIVSPLMRYWTFSSQNTYAACKLTFFFDYQKSITFFSLFEACCPQPLGLFFSILWASLVSPEQQVLHLWVTIPLEVKEPFTGVAYDHWKAQVFT